MITGPNLITDGLVLYLDGANKKSYPGSGTTWYDLSGYGNNGTLVNTPIYSTSYNGIYQLDGTNDYFTVGGVTTGVTWSAFLWFYYDGQVIFQNRGHRTFFATSAFRYQWDDNNIGSVTSEGRGPFLNFNVASGGYTNIWYNSITAEILLNRWHCVGITSDGTILKNYFDGVQRSNNATYPNRQFSLDGNMRIAWDGISGIGSADWFYENGGDNYIGPFLHYNRALTSQEVLQNYNATKSRFGLI